MAKQTKCPPLPPHISEAGRSYDRLCDLAEMEIDQMVCGMLYVGFREMMTPARHALRAYARSVGWNECDDTQLDAIWQRRKREFERGTLDAWISEDMPPPVHRGTDSVAILNFADFMGVERPPLEYWIDGLLPTAGKLLITGAAKAGKTFWALNAAVCLASGNMEWLGLRFGKPAKVLVLQPELTDTLMETRLAHIVSKTPPEVHLCRDNIRKNLHIWQRDVAHPVLTDTRREIVHDEIAAVKPDVVVCDPLYALFPGLVENAAEEVTQALDLLTSWTQTYGCAVILVHHHGKGGYSRGSSVLQGWPETDLSMNTIENEPDHVEAHGLFRCSFGDGFPAWWTKPNREYGWFRQPPEAWEPEKPETNRQRGRQPAITPDMVRIALEKNGQALSAKNLRKLVSETFGVTDRTARRHLDQATKEGKIELMNGAFVSTGNRDKNTFVTFCHEDREAPRDV